MLAGILIAIVVVAGLAFALPYISAQRAPEAELIGEVTERFSQSVRILSRDITDYREEDVDSVSTPLTRRAQLDELRMIARQAARRRMIVVLCLVGCLVALFGASVVGVLPWWPLAIPAVALGVFLGVARFSVVAMHRSLDARAAAVRAGFDEQEDTTTLELGEDEVSESVEISVDLSIPPSMGALWDPIPVTPATYVSQPLLPRTVRTIDLSAPVVPDVPVPTADAPGTTASEETQRRAVGE